MHGCPRIVPIGHDLGDRGPDLGLDIDRDIDRGLGDSCYRMCRLDVLSQEILSSLLLIAPDHRSGLNPWPKPT